MNYGAMFKKEITEIGNSLGLEGTFTEEFGFDQIAAAISALKATPSREERLEEALVVAQSALDELATFGRGSYLSNNIADEARCKVAFILSPPPEYEEVEVVRWECPVCGNLHKDQTMLGSGRCCADKPLVKLTGTIKREKPRKVQRRVKTSGYINSYGGVSNGRHGDLFNEFPESYGKHGSFTFTWEEQP